MELPEEGNLNQTPNKSFLKKLLTLAQTKRSFFLLIFLIFLFIPFLFLLLNNSEKKDLVLENKNAKNKDLETPKTWEIILSFDQNNQKVSLKNLSLINKRVLPDQRSAQFSSYEVLLLSGNNNVLYKSKVYIAEEILYSILSAEGIEDIKRSDSLESVVYVPFYPSGTRITITKNSTPVLEISLPKNSSSKDDLVLGDTSLSCGPMTVVFISDNYSYQQFNQYEADVASIISVFSSIEPYNSVSSIFDYQIIKNETSLGCNNGLQGCFNSKLSQIKQIGLNSFPRASRFIVLVNNPDARAVDGEILGGTNGPGGEVAVFTTHRSDVDSSLFKKVAVHEFLGHSVGVLFDRYIYPPGNVYSTLDNINIEPNCANPQSIPPLWKNQGVSQTFPGCTSQYLYAPFKRDCIGNNGNSKSVMSTASCSSSSNFDTIEKNWIQTQIIPMYPACPTPIVTSSPTPTPTPTPVVTSTPTPTPTLRKNLDTINPMACNVQPLENVKTTSCTYYNGNDSLVPGEQVTRWCRTGTWTCADSPPYRVNNWCKANEKCSLEFPPVEGPNQCLECSQSDAPLVNDTEANNGYYCINFEGDCSANNCSDCSDTSKYRILSHTIKENQSRGCRDCSVGTTDPGHSSNPPDDQPVQVQYNCVEDPKCSGKDDKSMQLCQLICTPKN